MSLIGFLSPTDKSMGVVIMGSCCQTRSCLGHHFEGAKCMIGERKYGPEGRGCNGFQFLKLGEADILGNNYAVKLRKPYFMAFDSVWCIQET